MLFTLKRKFFTIAEERGGDQLDTNSKACAPRKRLRVQGPTSIHEANTQDTQAAVHDEGEISLQEMEEEVEELKARVKELEEMNVRIKKEAEQVAAKLKKVEEEDVECMVCQDMVHNPQLLQCGHSACYRCLRNWWTQPPEQYDAAEMIDTEAEAEFDRQEEDVAGDEPNPEAEGPAPEPRARRRHQFSSAVNRKKRCPYCNNTVTHRPTPDFQLRDVIETLNHKLVPVPPSIQARRQARLTRRSDPWHGIFHPVENSASQQEWRMLGVARLEPQPGPPPPQHPDPILNHIAQAQHRRVVEGVIARRERVRAQAYEEGRMRGIMEIQARWQRAEEARQAAMDQGLAQGNLPPARENPVVGAAEDVVPDPAAM